jgi:hypothetical protein
MTTMSQQISRRSSSQSKILNPPPAPSWSGTDYWAEDPEKCIRCIIHQSRKATDRPEEDARKWLA